MLCLVAPPVLTENIHWQEEEKELKRKQVVEKTEQKENASPERNAAVSTVLRSIKRKLRERRQATPQPSPTPANTEDTAAENAVLAEKHRREEEEV